MLVELFANLPAVASASRVMTFSQMTGLLMYVDPLQSLSKTSLFAAAAATASAAAAAVVVCNLSSAGSPESLAGAQPPDFGCLSG